MMFLLGQLLDKIDELFDQEELETICFDLGIDFDNLAGKTKRGSLPVGSRLDSQTGMFYWQPGPGFKGTFPLVFHITNPNGSGVRVLRLTCTIK